MSSSRIYRKSNKAFTLAEIMVALVILSVAVLGLVSAMIYSMRAGGGNRLRHTASVIAYRIMNEKETQLRKDFCGNVTTSGRLDVHENEGFQYCIQDVYQADDDLKKISLSVYWDEEGADREYSIYTYIYKYK
ncbi:MAG: prepilin-type N-terminal cleavage/methylation domain-containing protein [Vulcanimicrobiota bacterium]